MNMAFQLNNEISRKGGQTRWAGKTRKEQFWENVKKDSGVLKMVRGQLSECWIWTAGKSSKGYAYFSVNGKAKQAYKIAYEWEYGPVPDGMELDHLCRTHECIRPDHQEAVTRQENQLRGDTIGGRNSRKTTCPKGHPYNNTNKNGGRICNVCINADSKAKYLALKATRPVRVYLKDQPLELGPREIARLSGAVPRITNFGEEARELQASMGSRPSLTGMKGAKFSAIERFWLRVQQNTGIFVTLNGKRSECWMWMGSLNVGGYGNIMVNGFEQKAHIFSYLLRFGPFNTDLVLDHLCRNRWCVRPNHLEPITQIENVLRGNSPAAANAKKTACGLGHPLDGINSVSGYRYCKTCQRANAARFARNKRRKQSAM